MTGTLVVWTETDQEELDKIYKRAKEDELFREAYKGRDFKAPTKEIYGVVLAIAYQQEQVAMEISATGCSYVERVKPCWKLLIAVTATGRIVEKTPESVRVLP